MKKRPEPPRHVPQMLTVEDVAKRLSCGRGQVRKLIKDGRLRAVRYTDCGHYRIAETTVASFLGVRVQKPHELSDEEVKRRRRAARARLDRAIRGKPVDRES